MDASKNRIVAPASCRRFSARRLDKKIAGKMPALRLETCHAVFFLRNLKFQIMKF
jgi:hypothetical protein